MENFSNYEKKLKHCKHLDLIYYILFTLSFILAFFLPCFTIKDYESIITISIFDDFLKSLKLFDFSLFKIYKSADLLSMYFIILVIDLIKISIIIAIFVLITIGFYRYIKKIRHNNDYETELYNKLKKQAEHKHSKDLFSIAKFFAIVLIWGYIDMAFSSFPDRLFFNFFNLLGSKACFDYLLWINGFMIDLVTFTAISISITLIYSLFVNLYKKHLKKEIANDLYIKNIKNEEN